MKGRNHKASFLLLLQCISLICFLSSAIAEQRFPPPEFEGGHQLPVTATPPARAAVLQYVDVAILFGTLALATWLIHKHRSRKAVLGLSIFSLLYFGFWRKGCVCSIGSVQNVAFALFSNGYVVPLVVLLFFVLPLVLALFFGRTFCAAVCPHGALQDLVLLKPVKVPAWLEQGLGVLPFVYLGVGVLFAATGSTFLICQYDPFVPIFRMNGRVLMVSIGIALLLLGMFVGRPYCRFLCPYGALLRMAGVVSRWRVRVTPDFCTQCRLCETSCPFGALRPPQTDQDQNLDLRSDRRRLGWLLLLLPTLLCGGAWLGRAFSDTASLLHPTVALANRFVREGGVSALYSGAPSSGEQLALERARQAPDDLLTQAEAIRTTFKPATTIFGAWVGLVVGLKLILLSVRRKQTDYDPHSGACLTCARCFATCPNELRRRGLGPAPAAGHPGGAETRTQPASA